MKLYRISWPYDYHCLGGLVVMASSPSAAVKKARKYVAENYPVEMEDDGVTPWFNSYQDQRKVRYDEVREVEGGVYETSGGC